jgi:hypothetical protein
MDGAGNPCVLVSESLSVTAGLRFGGVGATYHHPVAVVRGGNVTAVTDVVMIAKLAGLLAVTLAMIVGVMRR